MGRRTNDSYVKKCSTLLAIKGLHLTMTLRFYLTPVGIAIFKKKK
jgi:hypothetical protein